MSDKKIVAIIQARMGSTRFPGKVMKPLAGAPVLGWVHIALSNTPEIDEIVIATSNLPADDVIVSYCVRTGRMYFRGSETDVLDRMYQCAKQYGADIVIRITADCPFIDPQVVSEVVRLYRSGDYHYASNIDPPSYPDGLDVECFSFEALECAWREAARPSDRDCVPQYIVRNRRLFPAICLKCPLPGLAAERWVLDTELDYKFCQAVATRLEGNTSYLKILRILDKEPELRLINKDSARNERFYDAVSTEPLPRREFTASKRLFDRATRTIPFGAQTFSKSHLQFPPGVAPLYVSHADGGRIYDVDGNDYVDLVNAVLPVVLGYRDPDVDEAIRRQLDRGISFSLATELEAELAELLCRHIPCAEMVKFGKSGTDVTTAAVRLARAYTDREHILLSGYHGWADWSMAPTNRALGIPIGTRYQSTQLPYGDYELWNKCLGPHIAAVIVEPESDKRFLGWLYDRCHSLGIVLIFDEVITGFRWAMGGAQSVYGVTPDLACFGKAMGNGMPISALAGSRKIMSRMAPPNNIFYSGTMFGETLSIAAAIATIKKMESHDVIKHLWDTGLHVANMARVIVGACGLASTVRLSNISPRTTLTFHDAEGATANQIRTLFMQEMIQSGVLIINSHNVSWATRDPEIKRIMIAYKNTLETIADAIKNGDIASRIGQEAASVVPLRIAQ